MNTTDLLRLAVERFRPEDVERLRSQWRFGADAIAQELWGRDAEDILDQPERVAKRDWRDFQRTRQFVRLGRAVA